MDFSSERAEIGHAVGCGGLLSMVLIVATAAIIALITLLV